MHSLRQLSCDKEEMCALIQPQILTNLSSRVLAPLGAYPLGSPALPAYPGWIGGHVLTKALILTVVLCACPLAASHS